MLKKFIILFLICLLIIVNVKNKIENFRNPNLKLAIHTVFISKENILFLEEWIDYHIILGFDKFYLYDNSKVNKKDKFDSGKKNLILGKVNKYNFNYNEMIKLNLTQVNEVLNKIVSKYNGKIKIIEWSPQDKEGNIIYDQINAHNNCLKLMKKDNIDWCANIDMDEFIVLENHKNIKDYINSLHKNISNLKLSQIRFQNRFDNINKNIIDIENCEKDLLDFRHSNKNIFKIKNTSSLKVHSWKGVGKEKKTNLKGIWFNHYKLKNSNFITRNNINNEIKKKIHNNSKNYIIRNVNN